MDELDHFVDLILFFDMADCSLMFTI